MTDSTTQTFMKPSTNAIAQAIVEALGRDEDETPPVLSRLINHFSVHSVRLKKIRPATFAQLRQSWLIEDADYAKSFRTTSDQQGSALRPLGDMGFSGSTFFSSHDSAYLVKSVPRKFEYTFFQNDLLEPYAAHMRADLASLLVRITDFLGDTQSTLGTAIGSVPSHHIVMENTKYGQDRNDEDDGKWESYDLKPMSYFYPERDVADGAFATDEALSKLADEFKDKLVLDLDTAEDFKAQLEKDTALLAKCNAVDYSLYLVRIPIGPQSPNESQQQAEARLPPKQPPFVPPAAPNWRTGIKSADGKWYYRASILDFFWAKHKTTTKLMTGLIKSYNLIDKQGPMSITTNSSEYRDRFLKMCRDMIEVHEDPKL